MTGQGRKRFFSKAVIGVEFPLIVHRFFKASDSLAAQ
jgi:hypothetical protein